MAKTKEKEGIEPVPGQRSIFDAGELERGKVQTFSRREKSKMTLKERRAIAKIIEIASEPERFAIEMNNTREQNQAIIRVLKMLYIFEGATPVKMNEDVVDDLLSIPERPKYNIF